VKRVALADLPDEPVSHDPTIRKRVWLRAGALPHVTQLAQARLAPGQVAPAHAHADLHEVFVVEAGLGVARVDGRPYPLGPGVCVAIEPGEMHEIACTGTEPLVLLYFGLRA
jgi:mannose-6-phosphate isomerase-like protein (cupin superfamily)